MSIYFIWPFLYMFEEASTIVMRIVVWESEMKWREASVLGPGMASETSFSHLSCPSSSLTTSQTKSSPSCYNGISRCPPFPPLAGVYRSCSRSFHLAIRTPSLNPTPLSIFLSSSPPLTLTLQQVSLLLPIPEFTSITPSTMDHLSGSSPTSAWLSATEHNIRCQLHTNFRPARRST